MAEAFLITWRSHLRPFLTRGGAGRLFRRPEGTLGQSRPEKGPAETFPGRRRRRPGGLILTSWRHSAEVLKPLQRRLRPSLLCQNALRGLFLSLERLATTNLAA